VVGAGHPAALGGALVFRNLQIRSKLVAILVLPLLTLMAFATAQVLAGASGRAEADRLSRATQFASGLTVLVDALQRERALSGGQVAASQPAGDERMPAGPFLADTAVQSFRRSARALDTHGFSSRFRRDLAAASQQLDRLAAFRASMDAHPLTTGEVARFYGGLLDSLLVVIGDLGAEHGSGRLGGNVAALTAIAHAKEAVSRGQSLLFAALSAGRFTAADYQRFAGLAGQEQAWLAQFRTAASADQRAFYAQTVAGGLVEQSESMRQAALAARDVPPGLAPGSWFLASSAKLDLLHRVELSVAADATRAGAAASSAASRGAALVSVVMLLVVGLAVGSSLLLARSMAGPLVALERAARQVAEQQLPGVVERLQQADEALDLAASVDHIATALPTGARDEIGRLANAFSVVHRVAVRVAAEQAALRKSIGDMFVNLARRNQSLVDRQLNLIDELERQTEDPDRLEELFQLDHLATRMRRNAENLLVLASAEPGRRWSEPAPLADVARAAAAEVEQFTRVELHSGDDVLLAGSATSDLVHLLAELVENAVAFSPPETPVRVTIQAVAGGYLVEIEDRGLGMSDEDLAAANDRLANPPEIDFALSRVLGFFVVGRLAERHGIHVQLCHSWYGGVTALVLVPSALLLPTEGEARPDAAGALAPRTPPVPTFEPADLDAPVLPSVFEPALFDPDKRHVMPSATLAEDPHELLARYHTGRLQGRVTSAQRNLPPAAPSGGATAT
jgi:signal transduction histidine kinase